MSLLQLCRSAVLVPVLGPVLILGSALWSCAAQDRVDPSWTTLQVTPMASAQIDPSVLAVQAIGEERARVQQRLIAAGFEVRADKSLDVMRHGDDRAAFARDLTRLSDLFPGAVHLVVLRDGQRVEVGDALLITPRDPGQLSSLLARHHLQSPQRIVGATVRVVTVPRDDLLHLHARITALRADPDIALAEFDLITHPTLK